MPHSPSFIKWLGQKARALSNQGMVLALVCLVLGAIVLFLTFWIVYAVIWLAFDWLVPHTHGVRLVLTAGVVILLFVLNATTHRRHLEEFSYVTGTKNPKAVHLYIPGVGMGSTINPLSPEYAQSIAKVIAAWVLFGPRLLTESVRSFVEARRYRTVDLTGCAAILELLADRGERVPFADIAKVIPPGHDLTIVLGQLRWFDGILFLKKEPAGLTLTEEFLREVGQALGTKKKTRNKNDPL